MRHFLILICSFLLFGCKEDPIPKPKGFLSLGYPSPQYQTFQGNCPYVFDRNRYAKVVPKGQCAMNLEYPNMKATIYLSYKPVSDDLNALLRDAQKLAIDHTIRAEGIVDQPFVNPEDEVYGMFYSISGNAASQSHFYVTDSTKHFLTGSLYFYIKPNYDSIYPAAVYLQKDIRKIMESLRWQ